MFKTATCLLLICLETSALLDGLSPTMPELLTTINELKQRVSALEVKNSVGPIAFTAGLRNNLVHVGDHQHIVFDIVRTNIGGAYNPVDGHFIAPVRGAYVFFVVLTNFVDHAASVQLLRNGQFLGHVLADDTGNAFSTSTLAVTAQLEVGDHVWV
ncbi:complement C1q-like protein 4 isoform X2 [Dreissena polymorpha]|uniref:complement C1q-like protein 4 isoform X2 n=1 Tax=Dreissena polymorpha TaxID=45954 RepID=UPI0022651607|nr:complement C1q-like protein 4 isoform X2 [Dreissena polymorpha]